MNEESIQSQGGKARAESLTSEQRRAIASKGALTRWGKLPVSRHKGSFQQEFGIDADCYVLDDPQKTAVISQSGMGKTLGLSPRGNAFPRFIESNAMAEVLSAQQRQKITQPFKFQYVSGGAQPPVVINGFDVAVLIDVCRAVVIAEAEKTLDRQQKHVAAQAHVILSASAKSGIKGLVYALAGYNPTAQEVIAAFKAYVQEEARKYEKEFPPELYQAWYRLYEIEPIKGRGRPWEFKKLTVDHIYRPLAKSDGQILELIRANKAAGGDRRTKLMQFLNEVGTRALRMHLGRILEMAEDSPDRVAYEQKVAKRFGNQPELNLEVVTAK